MKNLTGKKFGRLTATSFAYTNKHGQAMWSCLCDCGGTKIVAGYSMERGDTQSCGCLKQVTHSPNRTHGMKGSREYGVWNTMKQRCSNPNVSSYKDYGGRGIKVCERWQSFENFYADMGPRPSDKHSIEREDNDGDYSPENCSWQAKAVQVKNKRSTRSITANGETLHLAEWARRLGCTPSAILARIGQGMPEEEAVTLAIPERPNSKLTMEDAKSIRKLYPMHSTQKLADKFGVSKKTILNVLHLRVFKEE